MLPAQLYEPLQLLDGSTRPPHSASMNTTVKTTEFTKILVIYTCVYMHTAMKYATNTTTIYFHACFALAQGLFTSQYSNLAINILGITKASLGMRGNV